MLLHERKQIQLYRQHLTNPTDHLTVARDLCGVQAQFMTNALHALRIRCTDFDAQTMGQGLVKNWTIRGTVHVFAEDDLPLFIHEDTYRRNDWHDVSFWNQRDGWALTPERQKYLVEVILAAVAARPRTREELKEICRTAGMTGAEEGSMFDAWGGGLREMCERGFLHYAAQEEKLLCASPRFVPLPDEEAQLEVCRRYLTHMAPATLEDICYYFKCSRKRARAWLAQLPVQTVQVQGAECFYLGELPEDVPEVPKCIFLAGFDPMMLAYEKQKSIYLPMEYLRGIFTRTGIVMPAVMLDGAVAARWKRTKGRLEVFAFRALTAREKSALMDAAGALWGDEVTSIRFVA